MSYIFVSHASADDDTVSQIAQELKAAGIELWVDHINVRTGDNWQVALDNALKGYDALLLVISRTSMTREDVMAEWRDADLRGRPIFPVIIDDIPTLDIEAPLRTIKSINLHTDWVGGIKALIAVLHGEAPDADAPVTTSRPITGKIDRRLTTIPISGRDADLAEITRLLKIGPTAILGVGGLGESRLAAEILLNSDLIDGAIWHTVSEISRAGEVLELLREHFNLGAITPDKATLAMLKRNKRLIVLDNAESVEQADPRRADYVALVDDLVDAGARVLLTSRVEWADIELCQSCTPHPLSDSAARQIVLDMAAAFSPKVDVAAHADEIAVAARLHPRLIEWAIRQMRHLPLPKVIADLQSLKSDEAQKALDEMILKNLRQMSDANGIVAEQTLKKLAVCRGGFTYEAAFAITQSTDSNDLDPSLKILQTWQFVSFDGQRFNIDPLVIAAVGEDEAAHRPHYDFYKALAWQHDDKQDYLGLDPESANLEAAFEWAMSAQDYEAAYWLRNACSYFQANRGRFEQRKIWLERVARELENHSDDMLRATVQNSLGLLYQEHPLGNRHENLKRAITTYEAALVYRTLQAVPLDYAMTQNNLGNAYADLAGIEEREANLKRALAAYEAALVYRTPQSAPLDYAMTQNNLGNVYQILARIEDQEANLKRALAAYEAALVYRTPQTAPLDYASTQNNLGAAYRDLAEVEERKANLKRAVTAYEAALVYRTPQAAPLAYAMTQNNLGAAYADLAEVEERKANLKRAVVAYEAALVYRTPHATPLAYAMTQYNLGFSRRNQGDIAAALACWREAEHYYRQMGHIADADNARRLIEHYEERME